MKNKKRLFWLPFSLLFVVSCNGGTTSSTDSSSSEESTSSFVEPVEDDKVHLIILTGQSGARGKALVSDLTDEQKEPNYDVDIAADGLTMPELSAIPEASDTVNIVPVEPGFGDSSTEFGPELGMAETLASRYPKDGASRKSVIVKYSACGSTFTDHWYSKSSLTDTTIADKLVTTQKRTDKNGDQTGPLTANLYGLIDATKAAIEAEGYEVAIDGAVFVHGEQDAKYDDNMTIYKTALEHFIDDLRAYVGISDLPFVITEAHTNSAKYSNELRSIQKEVATEKENTLFVDTDDLYTNTFEPWHFGPESNYELGHRAAAELIALNDNRKITSLPEEEITVPKGVNVDLPKYVEAEFDNGYTGTIKTEYTSTYDASKVGEQDITYSATTNWGTVTGTMKVTVAEEPYVDGKLDDVSDYGTKHEASDGLYNVYVKAGEDRLYFGAEVTDKEIWTDGEAWHTGDMGQDGNNDDFRVYLLTDDDPTNRYTLCLASAGLLRIYDAGATLSDSGLAKKNLVYRKLITDAEYHVVTKGLVNATGDVSEGMTMEMSLSFDDLGITDTSSLKVCFAYSDISMGSEAKTSELKYLTASSGDETQLASYYTFDSLL